MGAGGGGGGGRSQTAHRLYDGDIADDAPVPITSVNVDSDVLAAEVGGEPSSGSSATGLIELGSVDPLDSNPLAVAVLVVVCPTDTRHFHVEGVAVEDFDRAAPEVVHGR